LTRQSSVQGWSFLSARRACYGGRTFTMAIALMILLFILALSPEILNSIRVYKKISTLQSAKDRKYDAFMEYRMILPYEHVFGTKNIKPSYLSPEDYEILKNMKNDHYDWYQSFGRVFVGVMLGVLLITTFYVVCDYIFYTFIHFIRN